MLNKTVFRVVGLLFCAIFNFVFAQDAYKYDAKGKRNPFIPLVTADGQLIKLDSEGEAENKDLMLEGIIYDKNGISYAIVNSQIVKTGDFSGEYQILKIENNKVIFIKDGLTSEIELKKGEE